ncbi:hypothetical protein J6590_100041 [Homalodisca vitripennis]|nr:hypothetical protein J6590_100041 [Homalodisca vitripennis]
MASFNGQVQLGVPINKIKPGFVEHNIACVFTLPQYICVNGQHVGDSKLNGNLSGAYSIAKNNHMAGNASLASYA